MTTSLFIGKNMAQDTVNQLKESAAKESALAAKSKAELDRQEQLLKRQQADLRATQQAIVKISQDMQSQSPAQQQISANNIISLQNAAKKLKTQTIPSTNNKINTLATEVANYESNARFFESQANAAQENLVPEPAVNEPNPDPLGIVNYSPALPSGPSRDDDGNLLPGWEEGEFGDQFVGYDYISEKTRMGPTPTVPYGPSRDDDGNLLPGWEEGEFGDQFVGPNHISGTIASIANATPKPTVPYGPSRDDDGNLLPGWEEGEFGDQYVSPDYVAASTKALARSNGRGLTVNKTIAQGAQSNNNASNQVSNTDWRVKLSLANGSNYLYNSPDPGILKPLAATKGVIFPYLPAISVNYTASYDPTEIAHSNYKIFSYRQSAVDSISIAGEFTAQDTTEANYLLAVIHFFKSVTKMFYGKDENPKPGTPPPLCYLSGLGAFQFNQHPLVITAFTYTLPTDVDYIKSSYYFGSFGSAPPNTVYTPSPREVRLPQYLKPGGVQGPPQWRTAFPTASEPTYVPTKMQITLQANPIVTRNDISKRFSLKDYANGSFYAGSRGKTNGRGIW